MDMNGAVPKIDCGEKIGSVNWHNDCLLVNNIDHKQIMYLNTKYC